MHHHRPGPPSETLRPRLRTRRPRLSSFLVAACLVQASLPAARAEQPAEPQLDAPELTPRPPPASDPHGDAAQPRPQADLLGTLHDAELLLRAGDADEAARIATDVLEREGLAHDVLVDATRVWALALSELGRREDARAAFVALLTYAPGFQATPSWGPKTLEPYYEARAYWRDQPVQPGLDVRATLPHAGPKLLESLLRDPTQVVRNVHVAWRWETGGPWRTTDIVPTPRNTVDVGQPPRTAANGGRNAGRGVGAALARRNPNDMSRDAVTEGETLHFFARATDERGRVVFEVGREGDPREANVSRPPPTLPAIERPTGRSFWANPWVWVAAGAIAAGAGATVYVIAR